MITNDRSRKFTVNIRLVQLDLSHRNMALTHLSALLNYFIKHVAIGPAPRTCPEWFVQWWLGTVIPGGTTWTLCRSRCGASALSSVLVPRRACLSHIQANGSSPQPDDAASLCSRQMIESVRAGRRPTDLVRESDRPQAIRYRGRRPIAIASTSMEVIAALMAIGLMVRSSVFVSDSRQPSPGNVSLTQCVSV